MRINTPFGTNGASGPSKSNRSQRSGAASFSSHLPETDAADSASALNQAQTLDAVSFLSLQEENDSGQQRQQGMALGEHMLDLLDRIRLGLLLGTIPQHRLRDLEAMATHRLVNNTDPQLQEVLQDIALRVKVELAKLRPRS